MQFLTGLSLSAWLKIGAGAAFLALLWSWHSRGEEIEAQRLRVAELRVEISRQNDAIEAQRANAEQAKRDLAQAEAASAGADEMIERLRASSRAAPAGAVCEPSKASKEIWR